MIPRETLKNLIRAGKIKEIFIEHLGWDGGGEHFTIPVKLAEDEYIFNAEIAAQKRGFALCLLRFGAGKTPPKAARQKLQRELSRYHYEHLAVLMDENGNHIWTTPHHYEKTCSVHFYAGQEPDFIREKLRLLHFTMAEEKNLTLPDVVERVRTAFAFNAEQITNEFFTRFKEKLDQFQEFIIGLQDKADKKEYAALMLNRLMFIYFIQSKEFLNGEVKYLRNRLNEYLASAEEEARRNPKKPRKSFYKGFYKEFLMALFHGGLDQPETQRKTEIKRKIGDVPYLNGGLFDLHKLEQDYKSELDIKDGAFIEIFDFLDEWTWHLDDRATASGKDINPDVIGYIFEKYINKRADMGAYYTQEDITGYIARNTILPHLLQKTRAKCPKAFDKQNGTIWKLLRENPDRYIYDSVRKGGELPDSELPEHIEKGLDENAPELLNRRKDWNQAATENWALPTETWRESLTRRARYLALKQKIKNGEVCEIADLITHNLDIKKLTEDFLEQHKDANLIFAFFAAIAGRKNIEHVDNKERRGISVLDPACGSGAFLFAALNVLEPLYEICINLMQKFVSEDENLRETGKRKGPANIQIRVFRSVLDDMKLHANEKYWIYRNIILHNLFGVDIMPEAVEVAKLRLFLKLAAESEMKDKAPNMGLEPLPDIDFNIRSGNALVGFASKKDFEKMTHKILDFPKWMNEINLKLGVVGVAYRRFIDSQTDEDINNTEFKAEKENLRSELLQLNQTLNQILAYNYGALGVGETLPGKKFYDWEKSHKPFHWLAEFYEIMENGGFDVVIGNPPYVGYTAKLKNEYTIKEYRTESCGDLYAFFVERIKILSSDLSPMSMIIPLPAFAVNKMLPLRQEFAADKRALYISFYSVSPSKLFQDAKQRLAIFLQIPQKSGIVMTTNYLNWKQAYRDYLINSVSYSPTNSEIIDTIPKINNIMDLRIYNKINTQKKLIVFLSGKKKSKGVYYHDTPEFWTRATDFIPYFYNDRDGERQSSQIKSLYVRENESESLCAVMNSTLMYWWFVVMSDCRHFNMREINNFPLDLTSFHKKNKQKITPLVAELMENYRLHAKRKETYYKTTGKVIYEEFRPRKNKSIVHKIDKMLAEHYGFTEEELDYIINYDYKYRMGGADG